MDVRFRAVVSGALVVGSLVVGCSSDPAPPAQPGTIPAGTAEATVDGRELATSKSVYCTFIQSTTTITTGDDASGATVVVNTAKGLDATSVEIRNLAGFTGSYWRDLGHDASVSLTGRTFTVAGVADGFSADNPSQRIARPFSIKASC